MHRRASFKIYVTRREMLYVGDQPEHTLMLTEMEGEAVDYTPGVAGEFVSRRSVGFHDRTRGEGPMRFEGVRKKDVTTGTWKVYKGIGKLQNLQGSGTFEVKSTGKPNEFILDMQGEYVL
jgi:hypothetical protein